MKIRNLAGILLFIIAVSGCGIANRIANSVANSSAPSTTNSELWPDVPPFPGAAQSDVSLPIVVRKIVETLITSSENNNSKDFEIKSFDFVSRTTDKTPEDLSSFYTTTMMASKGWNSKDQPGCKTGGDSPMQGATFCLFGKEEGNDVTIVAIIATRSNEKEPMNIFYVRASGRNMKPNKTNSNTNVSEIPAAGPDQNAIESVADPSNMCDVLPARIIEAALKVKLVSAPERYSFANDGKNSGCTYDGGKNASGDAVFAYAAIVSTQEFSSNRKGKTDAVPGLGEDAYFVNGADARQLWVLVGNGRAAVIAIGDRPNETAARAIAAELLNQLSKTQK